MKKKKVSAIATIIGNNGTLYASKDAAISAGVTGEDISSRIIVHM
jgi:hypothetical protein